MTAHLLCFLHADLREKSAHSPSVHCKPQTQSGSDVLGKLVPEEHLSDPGLHRPSHSTFSFLAPHFAEDEVGMERNLFKESKTMSPAPYAYSHPLFPVLPGRTLKQTRVRDNDSSGVAPCTVPGSEATDTVSVQDSDPLEHSPWLLVTPNFVPR